VSPESGSNRPAGAEVRDFVNAHFVPVITDHPAGRTKPKRNPQTWSECESWKRYPNSSEIVWLVSADRSRRSSVVYSKVEGSPVCGSRRPRWKPSWCSTAASTRRAPSRARPRAGAWFAAFAARCDPERLADEVDGEVAVRMLRSWLGRAAAPASSGK